jgi:hypothetical protein
MTKAEKFILENQHHILCLLAVLVQSIDEDMARTSLESAKLINDQIHEWEKE